MPPPAELKLEAPAPNGSPDGPNTESMSTLAPALLLSAKKPEASILASAPRVGFGLIALVALAVLVLVESTSSVKTSKAWKAASASAAGAANMSSAPIGGCLAVTLGLEWNEGRRGKPLRLMDPRLALLLLPLSLSLRLNCTELVAGLLDMVALL